MKNKLLLALTLTITGFVTAATPQFSAVPVRLGLQKFAAGDSISIREILATSPRMDVGDTVVVRGRYVLQSHDRAKLGLSLTQTETREPTPVSPSANMTIQRGDGEFELTFKVNHVGCLHLTFNSLPERKKVGTVYFGTSQQLERVRNMRW